jgi:hypothetical protein
MIDPQVQQASDGYRVDIHTDRRWLQYGPYPTRWLAEQVRQRVVAQLRREQAQALPLLAAIEEASA